MADIVIGVFREFGWNIGLAVVLILGSGITIRTLAARLERLYEKRIEDVNARITELNTAHADKIKEIKEGHAAEIAALKVLSDKGWTAYEGMRAQADRLAEKYGDISDLTKDMADELLDRRRGRSKARGG